MHAAAVVKTLRSLGTPKKAKASSWFFKTDKGQYGYGDVFFGVTVPEQRIVAKRYHALPLPEVAKLLQSNVHECRLTALLILTQQYAGADEKTQTRIARFYLKYRRHVNNWDLVDSSAHYILGHYLLNRDRSVLYRLVRSKNIWDRRIAIIATFAFIKNNSYADTLYIAKLLISDTHDLIHKAVGWMLREVGNRSIAAEERFLKQYAVRMPRTMLRYAIEKFPEKKRKGYLALKNS